MRNAVGAVQSALVLGGGSDIARATMEQLVARGCEQVVLAARHPEALTGTADRLRELGATRVDAIAFDARATADHESFVERVFDQHGDIDLVLLAFGVLGDQRRFEEHPAEAFETLEVNYTGAVSVALEVLRRFRHQGHGTFVVLSSVAGERVRASNFVYGSSKAGLDGFSLGLSDAIRAEGLRVLVVRPGFVHDKMTTGLDPVPFATTPERVARDVVRGLERDAEIVWSPAILRAVLSAYRHLPRAVARRLPL